MDAQRSIMTIARTHALGWLAVAALLIAAVIAAAGTAEAHPFQQPAQVHVSAPMDWALSADACCGGAEHGHGADACAGMAHCMACAITAASPSSPLLAPAARSGPRRAVLPEGLEAVPTGHPPKTT